MFILYRGNHEQDLIYRTSVLIIEPDNQEALIGKGNAYVGLKRYEDALLQYDKVLEINPQNVNVLIGKGNVFLKIKDYDQAILQYDRALFVDSNNINALQGKSQVYVGLGEHQLATEIHQKIELIKNNPDKNDDEIRNDSSIITDNKKIPNWIRTVFKWFSDDLISEDEVIKGLKFLIENGIIKIS